MENIENEIEKYADHSKDFKEISNAYVTAFLLSKGFKASPKMNEHGRVIFDIEGKNIDEAISEFYRDPLQGYLKCLRVVRNWVYGYKDLQSQEGQK